MDLLCLEFINTQCSLAYKPFIDPLTDRDWLLGFSQRWGLPMNIPLSEQAADQLIALRTLLLKIIDTLSVHGEISMEQLASLNNYLASAPLYHRLRIIAASYQSVYEPTEKNWDYVLYKIASSSAEFISDYDRDRIKRCENPQCKEVFFDESKNNSKRFCGNKCLSLIKVRRFRERQKAGRED